MDYDSLNDGFVRIIVHVGFFFWRSMEAVQTEILDYAFLVANVLYLIKIILNNRPTCCATASIDNSNEVGG